MNNLLFHDAVADHVERREAFNDQQLDVRSEEPRLSSSIMSSGIHLRRRPLPARPLTP